MRCRRLPAVREPNVSSRTRDSLFITLILLAHFLVTVGYSLVAPLGEAPDELSHYDYFRYVAQERALPAGAGVDEAIQPPLYYLLGALLTSPIEMDFAFARSNPDFSLAAPEGPQNLLIHTSLESWPYRGSALAFHLVRLLSASLSTLTVWAIYRLGRELFPKRESLALGAAGFVAFIPEFCFIGGAVNNDNLAAAVGALLLWRLVRMLRLAGDGGHVGYGEFALLGLLLGAGLLTKTSFLAALPLAALVIGWSVWQRWRTGSPAAVRQVFIGGILAFVLAVFIAGGWYWRNVRLYGDPLAWKLILEGVDLRSAPLTAADYSWLARGLLQSFWGRFGGAGHIRLPAPVYWAAGVLSLAAALGLVRFLLSLARKRRVAGKLTGWQRCGLLLLAAWLGVIFVALLRYTAVALGTDQARLLYPALASQALLFVLGLMQWAPPRRWSALAGGITAGGFVFCLLVLLLFLRPIYAPPKPVDAAASADMDRTSAALFDNRLALVGHEPAEPSAAPGGVLHFTLYWRAERPTDADLRAEVWVLAPDGGLVASWKRSPTGGRFSTDHWPVGSVYADRYALLLPDWIGPGEYTLAVGVREFPSEAWLSLDGEAISPQRDVTTVMVRD